MHAEQLRQGYRWLTFIPSLETDFRNTHTRQYLPRLRVNLLLGCLIYTMFGLVDMLLLPLPAASWSVGIRLFFVSPFVVFTLVMTRYDLSRGMMAATVMLCMIVAGWSIVAIAGIVAAHGYAVQFGSMSLIAMFIYFMSGLLFYEACICGVQVLAAFFVVSVLIHLEPATFVYDGTFLIVANVFGMVGCYALEHANRSNYLRHKLLNELAERDGLTGLYNRRFFRNAAALSWAQAQREGARVVLMIIDVDYFKAYNDRYGHVAGDDCLRRIAQALSTNARRPLDLVARMGGEEFVLLWFGVEARDARMLSERVRDDVAALEIAHAGAPNGGNVSISGGTIVTTPTPERTLDEAIERADRALYEAKRQGRDRCIVEAL